MSTEVRAADLTPQPWRNGGGRTRELLAWPAGAGWQIRVSLADIDADGPFSAFAGVQRWFAVIEGAGVVLAFAGGASQRLTTTQGPIAFDGADAPDCRLVAGPTRDLNLMLRDGTRGAMARAANGLPWPDQGPWRWRAVFTSGPARWHGADGGVRVLAANTLLHGVGAGSITADDPARPMLWLGADFDPTEAPP